MTNISPDGCVLYIFRRDLRTVDNTALNAALSSGRPVLPLFILDPRQCEPHPYRSEPGLQFLVESLKVLDGDLKSKGSQLHILRGTAEERIAEAISKSGARAIYFNRDYTPFSTARDRAIKERAASVGCETFTFDDALINPPDAVRKEDGKPYTVFTPFYRRALKCAEPTVAPLARGSFLQLNPLCEASAESLPLDERWLHSERARGGRTAGLQILDSLKKHDDYEKARDIPSLRGTTRLGAHHKFGTISIRETATKAAKLFGRESTLVKELYWRDFFTQIGFYFPHVFEGAFHRAYDQIEWESNGDHFTAWCNGQTGFPIVDAGMRELNATGFMHNRVRMIVASFLTKDLHLHWRDGERYFARHLTDYDPAVNNGSWQWAASSGCDAQPYFRIFNPWLQQKKFDPDCLYIRKWIPELQSLSNREIHDLGERTDVIPGGYPLPIVEHAREKRITENLYARALKPGKDRTDND